MVDTTCRGQSSSVVDGGEASQAEGREFEPRRLLRLETAWLSCSSRPPLTSQERRVAQSWRTCQARHRVALSRLTLARASARARGKVVGRSIVANPPLAATRTSLDARSAEVLPPLSPRGVGLDGSFDALTCTRTGRRATARGLVFGSTRPETRGCATCREPRAGRFKSMYAGSPFEGGRHASTLSAVLPGSRCPDLEAARGVARNALFWPHRQIRPAQPCAFSLAERAGRGGAGIEPPKRRADACRFSRLGGVSGFTAQPRAELTALTMSHQAACGMLLQKP
jgi:hypothetical protein